MELGECGLEVGDVLVDLCCDRGVELPVAERQVGRIAGHEFDTVAAALSRDRQHGVAQIDAADAPRRAHRVGEISGEEAGAAADVEHVLAGSQLEELDALAPTLADGRRRVHRLEAARGRLVEVEHPVVFCHSGIVSTGFSTSPA